MTTTSILQFLCASVFPLVFAGCDPAAGELAKDGSASSAQEGAGNPGELDPRFGRGGRVEAAIGRDARLHAIALQPDGKVLGVGSAKGSAGDTDVFAVARFTANGVLDRGWGKGGVVLTPLSNQNHQARAVAVQADGKVVVAGAVPKGAYYQFAVARYNTDGTLDARFGSNGVSTTGFSYAAEPAAVVVQPDGRIVVAGTASGDDSYFALARYNADGSLDPSFGTAGKVTTTYTGYASAMASQPGGGVVVAGTAMVLTGSSLGMVRYDATGKLDRSFDDDGRAWTRLQSVTTGDALVAQRDGALTVVGSTKAGGETAQVALARFTPSGKLDAGFGSEGKVSLPLQGSRLEVNATEEPGGKLVVGTAIDDQFTIARLLPDGSLDNTFGAGGIARVPGGTGLVSRGLLAQGNGRIIAAGYRQGSWVLVAVRS